MRIAPVILPQTGANWGLGRLSQIVRVCVWGVCLKGNQKENHAFWRGPT